MLARHGTRYPGRKDIVAMQQFLPHIRDFIMKNPHNGKAHLLLLLLQLLLLAPVVVVVVVVVAVAVAVAVAVVVVVVVVV